MHHRLRTLKSFIPAFSLFLLDLLDFLFITGPSAGLRECM